MGLKQLNYIRVIIDHTVSSKDKKISIESIRLVQMKIGGFFNPEIKVHPAKCKNETAGQIGPLLSN